ncbi:unnamed protein product [Clonostachys rhizophaga]|uniref:Uncharacterized protein n=1 Tax=Clonostachys rhizophaga TaxID=160324 RepID=A0A9N9VU10_9HYPO|nr:unnamed protein product [Clonostachys rhizophaga]
MPDIQDAFQAALIIALLVTLALAALLAAVVVALRYWQPEQQEQTEPERRRSLYYPSTRSSVENAYRIPCVPDRPLFRNVDWSYGTFQGNRFESGPRGGSRAGFTVDDEHSISTRWERASPRGQLGGQRRMAVEERRDASSGVEGAEEDLTDKPRGTAGREGRDGEETSGSSTPLASKQGAGAASGWADRTRGGRGHSSNREHQAGSQCGPNRHRSHAAPTALVAGVATGAVRVIRGLAVRLDDTLLQLRAHGAVRLDVLVQHVLLQIEDGEPALLLEDVVPAAGEEVEGDEAVLARVVEVLAADGHFHEALAYLVGRVVLDAHGARDLEPGADLLAVELVVRGDEALEDLAEVGAGEGELDHGVAEGEGRQDLAAGDVALVDGGADAARVVEGEVGLLVALGLVGAVFVHGVGHDLAEEAVARLALGLVEGDGGRADDLGGEGLEGHAPLVDLGLEGVVLGGLVGQVDGGAVVAGDLAVLVEEEVDGAQVLAPAVRGDDEDLLALGVVDDGGVLALGALHVAQEGVAVGADDEVDAFGLGGELLVNVVADVRQGDDVLDLGVVADLVDCLLDCLDGILERDGRGVRGSRADDGEILVLPDLVVFDMGLERRILRLDVGRDDGEGQVGEKSTQLGLAAIPLVVSEGHDVELEVIEHLCNLLAAIVAVEHGALELISRVDPHAVGVSGLELIDLGLDAGVATVAALCWVGAVSAG